MDTDFVFTVRILNVLQFFYWILAVWERFFREISSKNRQTRKLLPKISRIFWDAKASALKYWTPWCVAQKLHMDHVNISDISGSKTHRAC